MTPTKYKATRDGFIIGTHYKKDADVVLTALQAKYLCPPYGSAVYVPTDAPKPAPAPTPVKDK